MFENRGEKNATYSDFMDLQKAYYRGDKAAFLRVTMSETILPGFERVGSEFTVVCRGYSASS